MKAIHVRFGTSLRGNQNSQEPLKEQDEIDVKNEMSIHFSQ